MHTRNEIRKPTVERERRGKKIFSLLGLSLDLDRSRGNARGGNIMNDWMSEKLICSEITELILDFSEMEWLAGLIGHLDESCMP